jgi:hypothetical protein
MVEWYCMSPTSSCTSSSTDTGVSGLSFTPSTFSLGTAYYVAVVFDSGAPSCCGPSNLVKVDVLNPADATQQLISTVNGMHLPRGTTTSLDAKLTAALNSLNRGSMNSAVNQLNAFMNDVNAQSGKKITMDQAQTLISYANAIIAALQS